MAWGGIEPPTQGFSIQSTGSGGVSVSRRNVTGFPGFRGWPSPSTEPAAEPFRALGLHGHRFFRMESTQWRYRTPNFLAEPMGMRWVWPGVALLLLCPATHANCIRAGYFNISMAIGARFRLGADIHLEPISGSYRRQSGHVEVQDE